MTALNFDRIARSYALLEKLTFGDALANCRLHFLDQTSSARKALVIGDGDGRFVAAMLALNPHVSVDSIDISAQMLRLQSSRCAQSARLALHQADARSFIPPAADYDLIVTHFFLDCLTQSELDRLVNRLTPHITPDALWLLSDFATPPRGMARFLAQVLIPALYLLFRLLTGLRVAHIPQHAPAFQAAGFRRFQAHTALDGILRGELWQREAGEAV